MGAHRLIEILKEESMPRVAFLILALTILVVGVGFAFLTGQSSTTAVNASPAISSDALQETSLTSTTSPEPVEVISASSTMYGSEGEDEFTSVSEGHYCDGEGRGGSSGY